MKQGSTSTTCDSDSWFRPGIIRMWEDTQWTWTWTILFTPSTGEQIYCASILPGFVFHWLVLALYKYVFRYRYQQMQQLHTSYVRQQSVFGDLLHLDKYSIQ
jgi:hypothetical protein